MCNLLFTYIEPARRAAPPSGAQRSAAQHAIGWTSRAHRSPAAPSWLVLATNTTTPRHGLAALVRLAVSISHFVNTSAANHHAPDSGGCFFLFVYFLLQASYLISLFRQSLGAAIWPASSLVANHSAVSGSGITKERKKKPAAPSSHYPAT